MCIFSNFETATEASHIRRSTEIRISLFNRDRSGEISFHYIINHNESEIDPNLITHSTIASLYYKWRIPRKDFYVPRGWRPLEMYKKKVIILSHVHLRFKLVLSLKWIFIICLQLVIFHFTDFTHYSKRISIFEQYLLKLEHIIGSVLFISSYPSLTALE